MGVPEHLWPIWVRALSAGTFDDPLGGFQNTCGPSGLGAKLLVTLTIPREDPMPNCIILLRALFAGNFNDLRTRPIIRLGSLFIFLTLISCAFSFLCFSIILFICLLVK